MTHQQNAPSTDPPEAWEIKHEKAVKRACMQSFGLCLVSVLPCLLSFVSVMRPASQPLNLWFQRSGSVMTIFALLAQSKASYLKDLLTPNSFSTELFNEIIAKYSKYQQAWNLASMILVILGTAIWGYGDLLT